MKQCLIRRISNGERTNIWTEQLDPRDVMVQPYGRRSNNPPKLVYFLIDHTSASWSLTKLEEVCLRIDITAIR